ncbi:tetratricopeptide repeat protein [Rhizobacter sp. J219]|uniref:type VI secretion system accessory protein TagJ n=1 Tax=Rhizobacter sp. J219 TaxID=2898430 RepID=UPI002150D121|nr:type VI secretion system accessory protein TagJ [Rhizobacter sp. J219]MCR5882459.1 tetratricopeptide repeat protein [Rhizobacter sp. J219]
MATAQELVAAGDPQAALQLLQQQVRDKPGDAKLRVFLFQLLAVLGQWERAMAQLDVCGQLDASTLAMVNTYREAIKCEAVRGAVFAGKTTPVVFGKPSEWIALLIQALAHDTQGQPEQAQALRAQAFEAAPTTAGTINGEAFDWIADADSRLGPVLEVVLNGRYTWVPFDALLAVHVEEPEDLRDMVWAPAHLTFANGGESVALIPTCYPGTREQPDGKFKLARATEWLPSGTDQYAGLGQRVISTSSAEVLGLLEVREIKLTPAA